MTSTGKRGRPKERRLADFLATLNIVSQPEIVISAFGIVRLLNVSLERAEEMLDQIAFGSDGVHSEGLVNLIPDSDGDKYQNASTSEFLKPLRLTEAQAKTCLQAFARLGITPGNPLYKKTVEAFFPVGFENTGQNSEQETRSFLTSKASNYEALMVCAKAKACAKREGIDSPNIVSPIVSITYAGTNDEMGKSFKRIVPLSFYTKDDSWFIRAYDCDSKTAKDYTVALIKECRLENEMATVPTGNPDAPQSGNVTLTCEKDALPRVLAWQKAHLVTENDDGSAYVSVGFYRGTWLAKHIMALGDSVSFDNNAIKKEMRAIARNNLKKAKELKKQGL